MEGPTTTAAATAEGNTNNNATEMAPSHAHSHPTEDHANHPSRASHASHLDHPTPNHAMPRNSKAGSQNGSQALMGGRASATTTTAPEQHHNQFDNQRASHGNPYGNNGGTSSKHGSKASLSNGNGKGSNPSLVGGGGKSNVSLTAGKQGSSGILTPVPPPSGTMPPASSNSPRNSLRKALLSKEMEKNTAAAAMTTAPVMKEEKKKTGKGQSTVTTIRKSGPPEKKKMSATSTKATVIPVVPSSLPPVIAPAATAAVVMTPSPKKAKEVSKVKATTTPSSPAKKKVVLKVEEIPGNVDQIDPLLRMEPPEVLGAALAASTEVGHVTVMEGLPMLPGAGKPKDPFPYRHFTSLHPCANRLLALKWDRDDRKKHLKKLAAVKPKVDNGAPRLYRHLMTKPKKRQMDQERQAEIHRNNKILLERMSNIMYMEAHDPEIHATRRFQVLTNAGPRARAREQIKIALENKKLLQRLQGKQPDYNRFKLLDQHFKHLAHLQNISCYPQQYMDQRHEYEQVIRKGREMDKKRFTTAPTPSTGTRGGNVSGGSGLVLPKIRPHTTHELSHDAQAL